MTPAIEDFGAIRKRMEELRRGEPEKKPSVSCTRAPNCACGGEDCPGKNALYYRLLLNAGSSKASAPTGYGQASPGS